MLCYECNWKYLAHFFLRPYIHNHVTHLFSIANYSVWFFSNFRNVLNVVWFVWLIHRHLNFISGRFGTLRLFHLHRLGRKITMFENVGFCTRTHPYSVSLITIGSGDFRAKAFPYKKTPTSSNLAIQGRWNAGSTIRETISLACHSNPSVPKTSRFGRRTNGWWEFLLHLPLVRTGEIALSDWEIRSPCRQSRDSVSAGDRSLSPDRYWDGWRRCEVLIPDPCKRIKFNQPWRGSWSHQRLQFRQGSEPQRIPNKAFKYLPSEQFSSWPRYSMRFSAPITFYKCESMLECSLSLKRRWIRLCSLPSAYQSLWNDW